MIMSLHDPIARKRALPSNEVMVNKKLKHENISSEDKTQTVFSEKMYSAYVKSALDSLDKVCIILTV